MLLLWRIENVQSTSNINYSIVLELYGEGSVEYNLMWFIRSFYINIFYEHLIVGFFFLVLFYVVPVWILQARFFFLQSYNSNFKNNNKSNQQQTTLQNCRYSVQ